MSEYTMMPLAENVEEMFIGPFGSSLKNDCFVDEESGFCMVYEQKHAIQKTMDVETRFVDEKKYNELKRFNVRGGDIIVSCRGTIGETFVVPEDAPLGIMHPSIMKIRLKDGVYDKFYFNLLLQKRLKGHEAEANGSGIKMAISAKALGAELFPVPTMKEQTQITDVISKVQSIIDDRKMELQKLDELIKARFVEMFGDPVDNPMGWRMPTVAEAVAEGIIAKPLDGNHGGKHPKADDYVPEGIPFIMANNLSDDGQIDYVNCAHITEEQANSLDKGFAHDGDVLITHKGTIGRTAIAHFTEWPFVMLTPQVTYYRPLKDITAEFLKVYFDSWYFQTEMMKIASVGSTRAYIGITAQQQLKLMVPPPKMQDEFVTFVHQVDKSKVVYARRY